MTPSLVDVQLPESGQLVDEILREVGDEVGGEVELLDLVPLREQPGGQFNSIYEPPKIGFPNGICAVQNDS